MTITLPILFYHSVALTGFEAFEQQLKYLRDHGYRIVRSDDYCNWFYEFSHLPRDSMLIIFDECYRDS